MKPGRELNNLISEQIMGNSPNLDGARPVRDYSNNMEDAWEVATRMGITLIPIDDGSWFAMVGPPHGYKSPADFIQCMQNSDFAHSGAAVAKTAALSICLAAIRAAEKRTLPPPGTAH